MVDIPHAFDHNLSSAKMACSPHKNGNSSSLTEDHLFALFAKYPEISFDTKEQDASPIHNRSISLTPINSSPISTSAGGDGTSRYSFSTVQTTPLRPLQLVQAQRSPETDSVANYLRKVRQTDLPEECQLCFTSLAQSIGALSTGMIPSTSGHYRINNTYFMDQSTLLFREISSLATRTREQVKQAASLRNLMIFKAVPTDDMLWAMYRQRAQLIIRLAAFPCPNEGQLIHNLARLYNATVYQTAQSSFDTQQIELPTMRMLNKLYDLFFTWSSDYRKWCRSMQDLKQQYMQPLINRILVSPSLLAEVKSMGRAKGQAEVALTNPVGPRMLPVDEQTIKALNLSARRKNALAAAAVNAVPGARTLRTKGRFMRQKTV